MEFNDSKNRRIILIENSGTITAYFNDQKIGYGTFNQADSENPKDTFTTMYQIHIDKAFQRAKIATQIFLYAKDIYPNVHLFSRSSSEDYKYTNEGLQFIEDLIKKDLAQDPDCNDEE
jgi:hypothetical protein